MKRIVLLAVSTGLLLSSCRKIEVDGTVNNNNNTGGTQENLILSGRISTDRTLKAGSTYTLRGIVYVVDGAKLTIEPGVTVMGEKSSRGTLVITRGTQILANGTAEKPIVFMSDAGANAIMGDWGGIVIAGRAKTNASFNGAPGVGEIEGGVNNAEGFGLYGGADDNDNSGVLKYVRIEYAGYAFLPDKELNGLTLASVGKGTTIDHVQVSYAADDSFEFFGGTVDCKYLIAYKGLDDDWDMDNGYRGRIQFAISFRDSAMADVSQSNGFEIDNDASGSNSSTLPQTGAILSNMTVIGPRATAANIGNSNYRRGIHTRRNSAVSFFNCIVMGWPIGWNLDAGAGSPTDLNYSGVAAKAVMSNNILAGNNTPLVYSASSSAATGFTTADLTNYFNRSGAGNTLLNTTEAVGLIAPFKYDASVNWNPASGSAAATGGSFTHSKLTADAFFTTTTYRGACAENDTWWKGWTRFF